MESKTFVFVLAGGSGERFWPMSRAASPKHLLKLLSEKTLLEATVERLRPVVPMEQIFVLTNVSQLEAIRAELPELPTENVIAEPAKRDTAPACALATAMARSRDPQSICALLPADAMIHDTKTFGEQFERAVKEAGRDAIITFGIPPAYPATAYGYLHLGECLDEELFEVRKFVEKPDAGKAEEYLRSGDYAWNAGIFLWRSEWFLKEATRLAPPLAEFIEHFPAENAEAYLEEHFPRLPKISVDYAILEKAERVVAVRAKFDWDDVGSWTSLPSHLGTDDAGNCLRGGITTHDSRGNIVISNSRHVALCGVEDLIVIETPDAVLVCHRDAAQDIKKLHPELPDELV